MFGLGSALLVGVLSSCLQQRETDEQAVAANGCATCHGAPERAGSSTSQAGPPFDLAGCTDPSCRGVGAHLNHIVAAATHGEVGCEQCHIVPTEVASPAHADTPLPAEITFGSVAGATGYAPMYFSKMGTCSNTYCHRDAAPAWSAPRDSSQACGSCHGLPPPAPHPANNRCNQCHEYIDAQLQFITPASHVDGVVDTASSCLACHGDGQSMAPPPDLAGNDTVDHVGVGAHQIHLAGGSLSKAVACGECHLVPFQVDDPGHWDDTPGAEISFGDVATAGGRDPQWNREQLRCSKSWCHGPSSADSSLSPQWTKSGGLSLSCDGCHGMPPPLPHADSNDCTSCHSPVVSGPAGAVSIVAPELHVDGIVQTGVP